MTAVNKNPGTQQRSGSPARRRTRPRIAFKLGLLLAALWLAVGCLAPLPTPHPGDQPAVAFTVLYTNDEHGWMEGMRESEGAANLLSLWRARHDSDQLLVLSGGDNWTGPAVSTWFAGRGMVEVMNALGYDAAAVGNHEFDFGLQALHERLTEAEFPYLSANLRSRPGKPDVDELGIRPYAILDRGTFQVGVVGLTTTSTPQTTNPANVSGFEFVDYEAALRDAIPAARAAGADVILVAAHVCLGELTDLAHAVRDLDIALFGGGHCNEMEAKEVDGAAVLAGGAHMGGYAWVSYALSAEGQEVEIVDMGVERNRGGDADPAVAEIVARWRKETDAELGTVVGFLGQGLPRRSPAMQALVTHTWLLAYPTADAAITNLGGFRADLDGGEITLADVVGMLPFDNVLVDVDLSGQQLLTLLERHAGTAAVGGLQRQDGQWLVGRDPKPLEADARYSVLVNDFMYAGGDGYVLLAESDPDAYNTAIDWRQPLIDWITAQGSTPDEPLDTRLEELLAGP